MRVTNSMTASRTLMNINRNRAALDYVGNQISSGKRLQVPSDDPISASRIIKFRARLAENEQYKSNVKQGNAWMEITEGSLGTLEDKTEAIRTLAKEAANGSNTYEERKAVIMQMNQLMQHIGTTMNQTYAGRYVFSGYRTEQPPILTADDPALNYTITQKFDAKDLQNINSFQLLPGPPTSHIVKENVAIVKLPYENITMPITAKLDIRPVLGVPTPTTTWTSPGDIDIVSVTNPNAYDPATAGKKAHYIQETGELVIDENQVASFTGECEIEYDKQGFKNGDLNPRVYFDCTDKTPIPPKTYTMADQEINYEFSVNTKIPVNTLAKNTYTADYHSDLKNIINFVTNTEFSDREVLINHYITVPMSREEAEKAADTQIAQEKKEFESVLEQRFNAMPALLDKHYSVASKERADLGSRMTRLENIESKLKEENISYTELLLDNEGTDIAEAGIKQSTLFATYSASLQVGSTLMQLSLADFLR